MIMSTMFHGATALAVALVSALCLALPAAGNKLAIEYMVENLGGNVFE
jgi:hypothetical protein